MTEPKFISFNGNLVPFSDAKVHVLAPGMKYGCGVFEGIRGYWNATRHEMFVFRLQEHLDRLQFSMKVTRLAHDLTNEMVGAAVLDVVRSNEFQEDIHIRPLVWVDGLGDMLDSGPVGWAVAAVARPQSKAVTNGVNCAVSSWRRINDNAMPPRVKATGNYINSRLAGQQARLDGYDSVLMLTQQGYVAESHGACFFMIRNGKAVTPSVTDSILESITRATLIELLEKLTGQQVEQRHVDRSEIYDAQEAFFCGSGYEIEPIITLDRHKVGTGLVGDLTRQLQRQYFGVVRGETNEHSDWLTPVYGAR